MITSDARARASQIKSVTLRRQPIHLATCSEMFEGDVGRGLDGTHPFIYLPQNLCRPSMLHQRSLQHGAALHGHIIVGTTCVANAVTAG
jgi:hypothetical protein